MKLGVLIIFLNINLILGSALPIFNWQESNQFAISPTGQNRKQQFEILKEELTNLEKQIDGIKNLHAVVDQSGHKIIFLHNIKPGAAKSSFGIEVAKISGMPEKIINRAYELLKS